MNLRKMFVFLLIIVLSCMAISSFAFDGDFVSLQQDIFVQEKTDNKLIIENQVFYIGDLLHDLNVEYEVMAIESSNSKNELSLTGLMDRADEIQKEREIREKQKQAFKNADIHSKGTNMKYPFYVTGYSAEDFDYILKGSRLAGYGYCFKKIEDEYGVNGLFAMSVATLESGLGKSNLGKNNNNFYGIRGSHNGWSKFDSVESGILYFGKLMNKKLYKGKTIAQIAPIYCNEGWALKISSIMDRYINKLKNYNS